MSINDVLGAMDYLPVAKQSGGEENQRYIRLLCEKFLQNIMTRLLVRLEAIDLASHRYDPLTEALSLKFSFQLRAWLRQLGEVRATKKLMGNCCSRKINSELVGAAELEALEVAVAQHVLPYLISCAQTPGYIFSDDHRELCLALTGFYNTFPALEGQCLFDLLAKLTCPTSEPHAFIDQLAFHFYDYFIQAQHQGEGDAAFAQRCAHREALEEKFEMISGRKQAGTKLMLL